MKIVSIFWFLCIILVYSCKQNFNSNELKNFVPNKNLLKFHSKMIYSVDSLQNLNEKQYQAIDADNFNPQTDTVKYLKDKIYISYLRNAAGCAKYAGDIQYNTDTIKLILKNLTGVVCAEENCWRVIYEIENKGNRKYIIKKY